MAEIIDLGVQDIAVYDIETENTHRFFANDILVHNSAYIDLHDIIEKVNPDNKIDFLDKVVRTILQPAINEETTKLCDYVNAYANKLDMKRECIYDKAIWTAKKQYCMNVWDVEGLRYDKPELKIVGLSLKKSSTPSSCRAKLKEALQLIIDTDENTVLKFISEYRKEFQTIPIQEIAFPRGVNDLDTYYDKSTIYKSATPIHVRASLLYNHYIKEMGLGKVYQEIQPGNKIKFIYLKEPNIFKENVMGFPSTPPKEFDLGTMIDYNKQFDKAFLEPLKTVLDAIGWKHKKVNSLFKPVKPII